MARGVASRGALTVEGVTSDVGAWVDLLLARAGELRKAGVLSIGVEGFSAVLAPAEREPGDDDDETADQGSGEPANPYENKASYPTGVVPSFGEVDKADQLPSIPDFPDPPGDG
jgi:hypothetical protein